MSVRLEASSPTGRAALRLRRFDPAGLLLVLVNFAICLFLLAPIVIVVVASFSRDAFLAFPPRAWSLRWYQAFFENGRFTHSLFLSLELALMVTVIGLITGIMAALALSSRYRLNEPVRGLLLAPLMVPAIVVGLAMLIFFTRLRLTGGFPTLVIAHSVLVLPFVVLIVSAGLQALDRTIEEAALSLGAGRLVTFFTVTLPLLRGPVVAGGVFAFLTSFDELVVTLYLASPFTTTLPVRLFNYIQYNFDPMPAAISTLLIALTVVLVLAVNRLVGFTRFF